MPESDKGSRAKLVPPQRLVISDYMPELLKSLWTAQEYWWELPFDGLVEWLDSSDGGGKVPEVNGLPGLLTALREMPEGERMDELQNLVLYWWDLSEKKTTALPLPPTTGPSHTRIEMLPLPTAQKVVYENVFTEQAVDDSNEMTVDGVRLVRDGADKPWRKLYQPGDISDSGAHILILSPEGTTWVLLPQEERKDPLYYLTPDVVKRIKESNKKILDYLFDYQSNVARKGFTVPRKKPFRLFQEALIIGEDEFPELDSSHLVYKGELWMVVAGSSVDLVIHAVGQEGISRVRQEIALLGSNGFGKQSDRRILSSYDQAARWGSASTKGQLNQDGRSEIERMKFDFDSVETYEMVVLNPGTLSEHTKEHRKSGAKELDQLAKKIPRGRSKVAPSSVTFYQVGRKGELICFGGIPEETAKILRNSQFAGKDIVGKVWAARTGKGIVYVVKYDGVIPKEYFESVKNFIESCATENLLPTATAEGKVRVTT
ncbi:hypothetical protein OHV05_35470 (plasmid) [Kitasatospora sp. NBC_00070]|uniref:hypothetical protein n=1 Tax=Kitasatospora sp. NBC_00070 TaxID=2975962 RepID=UPI002F9161AF